MDTETTMARSAWECDVHGLHSAIIHVTAVSGERKQERHYCMFCIVDRLDASGLKEMRNTALSEEEKS